MSRIFPGTSNKNHPYGHYRSHQHFITSQQHSKSIEDLQAICNSCIEQNNTTVIDESPSSSSSSNGSTSNSNTLNSDSCESLQFQEYLSRTRQEIVNQFKLFDKRNEGYVTVDELFNQLRDLGLDTDRKHIQKCVRQMVKNRENGRIELLEFIRVMNGRPNVVQRALNNQLAIANWTEFCCDFGVIFEETKPNNQGFLPLYIPELAKVNPDWFGASICSVDGQTFSCGDSDQSFSLQASVLPLAYCLACEQIGVETVHEYIGREPSGSAFNAFTLNADNKPHNPMVNTGGIVVCSLLGPKDDPSLRFGQIYDKISAMAGDAKITFHQRMYLSEKSHGERNFALAYFMRGAGVKGLQDVRIHDVLDFYFQLCSIQCTTQDLSVIAGTLASGGVCPLTRKRVLSTETVKNCLSLLYSCGMYDYSGQWAFQIGLPSKSGVSGCIMVIIPNVMGLAIYSPRIDKRGNSVRGIELCRRLTNKFNLSIFDELVGSYNRAPNQ